MSLANLITIARGLLIAPAVILLVRDVRVAAFVVFGLACLGDVLDGMVARARHEVTTWGKALDPAVDKLLYVSLLCVLYVRGDVSALALALFLIPQVGIGVGALLLRSRQNRVQGARGLGKAAAALSFGAVSFLILGWPGGTVLLYVAIAATYVATFDYGRTAFFSHPSDG